MPLISGEYIRQNAAAHEENCPAAMKDSFYYGFREGAKWMQHELLDYIKEIDEEGYKHILNEYCKSIYIIIYTIM